jgi:hypothetical protein
LAAQQGCPVVSLFLGSADPIKTAPFQLGAWVIQGHSDCSPCSHAEACHQPRHFCGDSVSVETVYSLVEGVLKGKEIRLSQSRIFQTQKSQNSISLVSLNGSFRSALEQTVWSAYLNGESSGDVSHLHAQPSQILVTWNEHEKFKAAVRNYFAGNLEISDIEQKFPFWQDSLIRLKRNSQDTAELRALIDIRTNLLNELLKTSAEVSHSGNTRTNSHEFTAEA